jgi:hypothetical protein
VSAREGRLVADLIDDSDGLAREALLDMSADRALGMVRVQALIATTTVVVGEAAARRGEIDAGVIGRLTPALENAQLAWSRSARRWAELTTPASRTDPALVEAAGQLRAAIRAAVANQTGWATPDQIAARIDPPATVCHVQIQSDSDSRQALRSRAN